VAECGTKYKGQIRTREGRVLDAPCGEIFGVKQPCWFTDYTDWYREAKRWNEFVTNAWQHYMQFRKADITSEDPLVSTYYRYQSAFERLPTSHWLSLSVLASDDVEKAVLNVEEGVCLLEQIEEATKRDGGSLLEVPGIRKTSRQGMNPLSILLAGAVVGGIGYYAIKKKGNILP